MFVVTQHSRQQMLIFNSSQPTTGTTTTTPGPHKLPGPSRVTREPPAMVTIEEIGTNDVVIACVIKISTVNCLT